MRMKSRNRAQLNRTIFTAISIILISACCASHVTAAAKDAQKQPQYGGILRVAYAFEGTFIGYPPRITNAYGFQEAAPAIEKLLNTDKSGALVPKLATGYKLDPVAKAITLSLRKGVKFHDGTDFDAEAVKWNLEQYIKNKSSGTQKWKSVDLIDNFTVRVNLTDWDSTAITALSESAGLIISPTAFNKNGETWAANNPVGTGPFQFVSWVKDSKVVYKKFPGYWDKGKPYLDGVEWNIITDANTREMSFRTNEQDLLSWPQLQSLDKLKKDGYIVDRHIGPPFGLALIPSSADPKSPWSNIKIRQAAQHAIDTVTIVNSILYGVQNPSNQLANKGSWGWNPDVTGYPYNPDKAKKLLIEAGYPNGFKTKIIARKDPLNDLIFTAVQGYLKAVGIDAEQEQVTPPAYDKLATTDTWDGLLQNALGTSSDITLDLVKRYIGPPEGMWFKSMSIPDDYRKAVLDAVQATKFENKKKAIHRAMKLFIDKYCLTLNIYSQNFYWVERVPVKNFGINETTNQMQWTPESAWFEKR
jgi:peptide/nickel transport system substrate-binding protein